jgi:hypothetical protein
LFAGRRFQTISEAFEEIWFGAYELTEIPRKFAPLGRGRRENVEHKSDSTIPEIDSPPAVNHRGLPGRNSEKVCPSADRAPNQETEFACEAICDTDPNGIVNCAGS